MHTLESEVWATVEKHKIKITNYEMRFLRTENKTKLETIFESANVPLKKTNWDGWVTSQEWTGEKGQKKRLNIEVG